MRRNILKILFVLLVIPFSLSGRSEEKQNKPEPEEEEKVLPIWIGLCEARAIGLGLSGDVTPRPFTYDLVAAIIRTMKAKVERIIIVDLRDQVFYAQVEISVNGMVSKIDARPSDALALASRMGAPIFVKKSVLEKAPTVGGEEKEKRGT